MAGKEKFTKKQIVDAIQNSAGIISDVAAALQCSRPTVYKYLDKYPDLKQMLDEQSNELVDMAESAAKKLVEERHPETVRFVLSTKGKNRGWTQRTEISGPDGGAIQLSAITMKLLVQNGLTIENLSEQINALIQQKLGGS
jgi:predicted transcriptional regulator